MIQERELEMRFLRTEGGALHRVFYLRGIRFSAEQCNLDDVRKLSELNIGQFAQGPDARKEFYRDRCKHCWGEEAEDTLDG